MHKTLLKKKNLISNAGFTIVEMLVVLGIFAVLTAVVVYKYGEFNAKIILSNMAYEVALQIREAQIFGLGARSVSSQGFDHAYGVSISINDGSVPGVVKTDRTILFNDFSTNPMPNNRECDSGTGATCTCSSIDDECVQIFKTTRGIVISNIYISNNPGDCGTVNNLTITFKRPNPDARIMDVESKDTYSTTLIQLEARNSDHQYVSVRDTGQISVLSPTEAQSICPQVN